MDEGIEKDTRREEIFCLGGLWVILMAHLNGNFVACSSK